MVKVTGVEPATSRSQSERSTGLSYTLMKLLIRNSPRKRVVHTSKSKARLLPLALISY